MSELSVLDVIEIASPCEADWDAMEGDDRTRHCSACRLNVYNLSNMTRQEAERLVEQAEGRLCVRFFRRADGTMLVQDCPVGVAALRACLRRSVAALAAIVSLCGGLAAGASAGSASRGSVPRGPVARVVDRCLQLAQPKVRPPVPRSAMMGDMTGMVVRRPPTVQPTPPQSPPAR